MQDAAAISFVKNRQGGMEDHVFGESEYPGQWDNGSHTLQEKTIDKRNGEGGTVDGSRSSSTDARYYR